MLSEIPGVTIRDRGERLCGIVTFTIEGFSAEEVRVALREHHINTWIVTRAASMRDFAARGLDEVTRASVHYYNTEDELARTADVLRTLVE
jgi:selenocysteine lyase/cysteine desulfurase